MDKKMGEIKKIGEIEQKIREIDNSQQSSCCLLPIKMNKMMQ